MKNKKAAATTINEIVFVLIAFFILVIIIGSIIFFGGNSTKILSWIIPNFNKTIEPVKTIEIIRYEIENAALSFYDGTQWITFEKGQVTLGQKQIIYQSALEDFQNYYLQEREQKIIPLNYKLDLFLKEIVDEKGKHLEDNEISYITKKALEELKQTDIKINALINKDSISAQGNIPINLVEKQTNKLISKAHLVLYSNDYLELNYLFRRDFLGEADRKIGASSTNSIAVENIFNAAKEWRDSIYKKPIKIRFNKEEGNFCAELKDNKDIVVNLAEEKESC